MIVPFLRRRVVIAMIGIASTITGASASDDLAESRHNIPPQQKHAPMIYPVSQESEFMISPCKPERDGYFGSTSGDPAILQYGFELETINTGASDVTDALDTIREHIMDMILASTFPTLCSYSESEISSVSSSLHNNNNNNNNNNNIELMMLTSMDSVTGFHFGEDYDAIQSCLPQQSIHNDCSIFTALLSVYGTDVTTITLESLRNVFVEKFPTLVQQQQTNTTSNTRSDTRDSDNDDETSKMLIQFGTTRLSLSNLYTLIISIPSSSSSSSGGGFNEELSLRTILTVVVMILCSMIVIYLIIRCRYRQRQINHQSDDHYDSGTNKTKNRLFDQTIHNPSRAMIWSIFHKNDGTDMTEMSSSSSSVSSWSSRSQRNTGIFRNVPVLRRQQRPYRTTTGKNGATTSIAFQTTTIEADSIYIVESDDDDDTDDNFGIEDDNNSNQILRKNVQHQQRQFRSLYSPSNLRMNESDDDDDDDDDEKTEEGTGRLISVLGNSNHNHNNDPLFVATAELYDPDRCATNIGF